LPKKPSAATLAGAMSADELPSPPRKTSWKRWAIALAALLALALAAKISYESTSRQKQEEIRQKEAEIRQLLQLAGIYTLAQQSKSDFITTNRAQNPKIPEEFWRQFDKEWDVRQIVEEFIPVYEKYFTLQDLRAINAFYMSGREQQNAFYASETGQKVQSVFPQVSKEGAELGRAHYRRIVAALEAEAKRVSTNNAAVQ
jgi:uncharacterized protein